MVGSAISAKSGMRGLNEPSETAASSTRLNRNPPEGITAAADGAHADA